MFLSKKKSSNLNLDQIINKEFLNTCISECNFSKKTSDEFLLILDYFFLTKNPNVNISELEIYRDKDSFLTEWQTLWSRLISKIEKLTNASEMAKLFSIYTSAFMEIQDNLDSKKSNVEVDISNVAGNNSGEALSDIWQISTLAESRGHLLGTFLKDTVFIANLVNEKIDESNNFIISISDAVKELSSSAQKISSNVVSANSTTKDAVATAESTTKTVTTLNKSASEIESAISLINDIANQTNLLALNATIEAARAGEAGKGFSVVASEVKGLAGQTAKTTQIITEQVESVKKATDNAVEEINQISQIINQVAEMFVLVTSASEEQRAATQDIRQSLSDVQKISDFSLDNMVKLIKRLEMSKEAAAENLSKTINTTSITNDAFVNQ